MSAHPIDLATQECHVWLAAVDDAAARAHGAHGDELLDDGERERAERFVFERDRELFRLSRVLLRTALSCYQPLPPRAWRFVAAKHHRPQIANPLAAPLHFSLSHTDGLVTCAIARQPGFGIDIEPLDRHVGELLIAERNFHLCETATLRALSPAARRTRFLELWTLKEAYAKARGLGFGLAFDSLAFAVDRGRVVGFLPPEDDGARWHFQLARPSARHVMALAWRGATSPIFHLMRFSP